MSKFRPEITLEDLNKLCEGNMGDHLGIEFTEIGPDFLKARMPVDRRTKQTMGLLHGGASVVLAETLGSVAANCVLDNNTHHAVGLDINANHIRSATEGFVVGITRPIHIGRATQVWEIRIETEVGDHLVCVSRITMAVLEKKNSFTAGMRKFNIGGEANTESNS